MVSVASAVEGPVDEAVVRRLLTEVGVTPGPVHGKQGKAAIRQRLGGYCLAARHVPWVVLVDLDRDADCAPFLVSTWAPNPAPGLCFRVAVRAVESWLLADAEAIAEFLGVVRSRVPPSPEALLHPKLALVNLARASRRRDVRADMAPRPGRGRLVGPAYSSRMVEFAARAWRPRVAAANADSLRRALRCLEGLVTRS